jgi:hypothetical protein
MIRSSFPTREQLGAMSIDRLRALDIQDGEEEKLVQEILDCKLAASPPVVDIHSNVDITTKEQEDMIQGELDEKRAKVRARGKKIEIKAETPIETPTEIPAETPKKFCEFCTSKGGKHKLDCKRPRSKK